MVLLVPARAGCTWAYLVTLGSAFYRRTCYSTSTRVRLDPFGTFGLAAHSIDNFTALYSREYINLNIAL